MSDREERIRLEHGSGGWLSRQLTEELIFPCFRGAGYPQLLDAGSFAAEGTAFLTTDTYVVDPLFFPGGDIGRLAVFGTCNDLAVLGAEPLALSLGLVIEEGFPIADLARVLHSIRDACREAGVQVITGDTKVVPAGKGGGLYVNTSGVGRGRAPRPLDPQRIREGDALLVSAPVGAHGLAVLAARESLPLAGVLRSDCAMLAPLCRSLLALGEELRFLRDATRGGVAAVFNEICRGRAFGLEVAEERIPVEKPVEMVADLLGLNPLEVANEGVVVAVVAGGVRDRAVEILRDQPLGRKAEWVGRVTSARPGRVVLETRIGGRRILDFPRGLLLPRIC
jgi:hydrogenase expression/formation protein HypE